MSVVPYIEKEKKEEYFTKELRTVKTLGSGTYGNVVLTSNDTAVKTISRKRLSDNSFLKEIQLLNSLNHPNVIGLIHWGFGKEFFYLEIPYGGLSLYQVLKNNYIFNFKTVMLQFLAGMNYLNNERGIIHGDLKPENITYNPKTGHVLIIDFDIYIEKKDIRKIIPAQWPKYRYQTLWYRAPELLLGCNPLLSESIDLWSVGVIWYQLLNNEVPFLPEKNEEWEQLIAIFKKLGVPKDPIIQESCEYYEKTYPDYKRQKIDVTTQEPYIWIFKYDPNDRITISNLLKYLENTNKFNINVGKYDPISSEIKKAEEEEFVEAVKNNDVQKLKNIVSNSKYNLKYNWNNNWALFHAAYLGNAEILKEILDSGVDVNTINIDTGHTALDYAETWNRPNVISLLKLKGGINGKKKEESEYEEEEEEEETKEEKKEEYEEEENKVEKAQQLFMKYVKENDDQSLKKLVSSSIYVYYGWNNNWALFHSAYLGNVKILKLILDSDINLGVNVNKIVNKKNKETGETALIYAISWNQEAAVKFLIERGANVNFNSKSNDCPLFFAIKQHYNPKIVELLLENGADVAHVNSIHESAYHMLAKVEDPKDYGYNEIISILDERGGDINGVTLEKKIINGVTIEIKETALHYAVKKLNIELVKALLSNGIDDTIKDHKGRTAYELSKQILASYASEKDKKYYEIEKLVTVLHKHWNR